MSQDYAQWKRRADLLHKAQRAMQDARDAVVALINEGYLPPGMLIPLPNARDRQDEAGWWLTRAIEEHQKAGRPEGMSRQDTGRDLEYLETGTPWPPGSMASGSATEDRYLERKQRDGG